MPPVSERQRRAMWAAAEGRSNLGIPKSVGEEFVKADAAGKPEFGDLSDYEAAEAIRDGELPSPIKYGDFWLFDLRITGTGAAYRDSINEYAFRDPAKWLSDEFLKRCNGLPVIFEHPDKSGLNSEEYRERSIGNIMIPYIKGDEVWGVAKIFDADAAALMQTTHRSTSPGVTPPKDSVAIETEGGAKVLNEDLPLILDHLAVCEAGVWDKGGPAEGVRLDSLAIKEQSPMTKEEEEQLKKERDDAVRRADAAEAKTKEYEDKARKDAEEREREDKRRKDAAEEAERADKARRDAEEREREDKRRKDAEEKARKDAEETERAAIEKAEKEKADKKRADRKARHDSEKHEGEHNDCSKCDEMEMTDKRKDAAPLESVNANQIEELKDARRHDAAEIEALKAQIAAINKQPTIEDRNEIAKAFHRADSAYQMLGEHAPAFLPGESPIAYRRRLADGLRKHSPRWKDQPLNDSITGPVFELAEDAIYNDALQVAKNPVINDSVGRLREIVTHPNGKTKVEFVGDPRAAWTPFMPPQQNFFKFAPQDRRSA